MSEPPTQAETAAADALWASRYAALAEYEKHLAKLAESVEGAPPTCRLYCASCPNRRVLGEVYRTLTGWLLLSRPPTPDAWRPPEVREAVRMYPHLAKAPRVRRVFLMEPNRRPAFTMPWRPVDVEEEPHVICPVHGRIAVHDRGHWPSHLAIG